MFEVFKKMPNFNVTISHLCTLNQTSSVIEYVNKNDAMVRRKDLTGIHFRVAYIPNVSFLYENNQASNSFSIFDIFKSRLVKFTKNHSQFFLY